ncbi:MAG: 16S rRNA (cytosine(967)-C(5))-methyltransferase RsmB [Nitrospirae bacterium]|nr:MAG: 16S rRNA (cytosine(967)-C(5))-methyltransferase RsmB [Nitrospirota bacterium]
MRTQHSKVMPAKPDLHAQSSSLSPGHPRRSARRVALETLLANERAEVFAVDALDRSFSRAGLDVRDRALTLELVYGVLRHRATLDWRLDHVADRTIARLPSSVRTALRLGAYQLLYLGKVPPSAAVNESVKLVRFGKRRQSKHWAGFVNAVLRSLIRNPAPPWPDPAQDQVAALSVRYSCPAWLAQRWLHRFGFATAQSLCRATITIPPLTIRTNTLRLTRHALETDLVRAGYQVRPTAVSPVGLILEKCGPVTELPQFQAGAFYIEDEAGQLVPLILDPQPGERVLDACAAPGGKATHLAALMQNRGEIVAIDRSQRRLRLLQDNCRRLGVRIITTVNADMTQDCRQEGKVGRELLNQPFDRILLDAPCSGLGVLRRHPEGKWQKAASLVVRHQATQMQMLEQAGRLLRPGGVLVYSTCSTEPDENEDVIEYFCKAHAEFRREPVSSWLPPTACVLLNTQGDLSTMRAPYPMDAFFAARLRKADTV